MDLAHSKISLHMIHHVASGPVVHIDPNIVKDGILRTPIISCKMEGSLHSLFPKNIHGQAVSCRIAQHISVKNLLFSKKNLHMNPVRQCCGL